MLCDDESNSSMSKDVHSFTLSIKLFFLRPRRRPSSAPVLVVRFTINFDFSVLTSIRYAHAQESAGDY
ncbi:hypothetical protein DPMN_030938 [Dreissena polymorpha]|uniref:Uncharacterized protein n=1 Tax=Dreissena polymorpha TaxID=45954 RepID=A0A9D4M1C0_DREPO|nr:hypothetical protein DPMN_030938 [Dreissena polymorpha]